MKQLANTTWRGKTRRSYLRSAVSERQLGRMRSTSTRRALRLEARRRSAGTHRRSSKALSRSGRRGGGGGGPKLHRRGRERGGERGGREAGPPHLVVAAGERVRGAEDAERRPPRRSLGSSTPASAGGRRREAAQCFEGHRRWSSPRRGGAHGRRGRPRRARRPPCGGGKEARAAPARARRPGRDTARSPGSGRPSRRSASSTASPRTAARAEHAAPEEPHRASRSMYPSSPTCAARSRPDMRARRRIHAPRPSPLCGAGAARRHAGGAAPCGAGRAAMRQAVARALEEQRERARPRRRRARRSCR